MPAKVGIQEQYALAYSYPPDSRFRGTTVSWPFIKSFMTEY